MSIAEIAVTAENASIRFAAVTTEQKNAALAEIAAALKTAAHRIIEANKADLTEAEKNSLAAPLLKRLKFDEGKLSDVCAGIESLIALPDPAGRVIAATELDTGLELYKVSCPIGVIGVVFESRPDALVQISTLCLKSGNAVLLKGGSEAANTNRILARVIAKASEKAGMPEGWLQLIETRRDVAEMLAEDEHIDLIIPRGSNEFVRYIMDNTNIPVLGHADGICHLYVAADADVNMAVSIAVDSKCQYVAVCNAAETLLVDAAIAGEFLPKLKAAMDQRDVELRGCEKTAAIIEVKPTGDDDWARPSTTSTATAPDIQTRL